MTLVQARLFWLALVWCFLTLHIILASRFSRGFFDAKRK